MMQVRSRLTALGIACIAAVFADLVVGFVVGDVASIAIGTVTAGVVYVVAMRNFRREE